MPTPSSSVIGHAFGPLHRWWMTNPGRAAALAVLWYLAVIVAAGLLGILPRHIQAIAIPCTSGTGTPAVGGEIAADGFFVGNRGILVLFAMPLAAFLMGNYFRLLDNALLTLDERTDSSSEQRWPGSPCCPDRQAADVGQGCIGLA